VPESAQQNEPALPPMSTLRTFIVEDNPVILNTLIATLEEIGDIQVVGSVGSEKEAVRELEARADEVDLVIVDIFLTSGSGLGVLRSAQDLKLPARRVVLSNYATSDMRRRCLSMGADQVFDKSSELDELIAYCEKMADA
jgi:DNA-binding NarL/FixJ family response regulator